MFPLVLFFDIPVAPPAAAPQAQVAQQGQPAQSYSRPMYAQPTYAPAPQAAPPPAQPQAPVQDGPAPAPVTNVPAEGAEKPFTPPVFYLRLGGGYGEMAGVSFYRLPVQIGGYFAHGRHVGGTYGLGYTFGRTPSNLTIHDATTVVGVRFTSDFFALSALLELSIIGFTRATDHTVELGTAAGIRLEAGFRIVKFEDMKAGSLELGFGGGPRVSFDKINPLVGDLFVRLVL